MVPLTKDVISQTLSSLRVKRKTIREERRGLDKQISGAQAELDCLRSERDALAAEIQAFCIAGRNDYSRAAIKQDFSVGIKE